MRAKSPKSVAEANAKKILVVYYSRSGFTGKVASRIARDCHADVLAIKDVRGRGGMLGYVRSCLEAALHWGSAIRDVALHGDYELVVIGTPIWFWNMSSPVRTFIGRHRTAFKQLAFFCTCGGSGSEKVFEDMQTLSGGHAVATLSLRDKEIQRDMGGDKLVEFVAQINRSVAQRQQTASTTQRPRS